VRKLVGIGIFLNLVLLLFSTTAQEIERYLSQKEQERLRRNRFLYEETGEGKDLLEKYYQSLLLEKGKKALQAPSGGFEEDLLKQLRTGLALEGPINPAEYIVGPTDGLSINLWSGTPLSFSTFVTPEGTVLIPTVAEIPVAGRTLKEVKEIVTQEVRKKYPKGDIGVTLLVPRSFLVNVAGIVSRPGSYVVSAVDRVDHAIYLANVVSPTKSEQPNPLKTVEKPITSTVFPLENEQKERSPSLRNIKLVRSNRDTLEVDLIRYYATGDAAYNPYLLDGDRVIVPGMNLSANAVSIWGAVRIPGRFEYHPGDSLSLMFKIANGPLASADLENAELVRFGPDGESFQRIPFNARKVLDGTMDIPLQPNDRVFLRHKPHLREEYNVILVGEVRRPGMYPITRDSTWLTELIDQAGGFTPEAAIAECKVIRKPNSEDPLTANPDYERLMEMRLSGMDRDERDYYNYEAAIKRGYVSVDFKKLFIDGLKSADVTLRDGDYIMVPSRSKAVQVYGQVANPGYIPYVPGMDYREYIEKAGGFSRAADRGKVSIIKAGSKKWVRAGEEQVGEGDAIFVPLRAARELSYYFAIARDVFTVATAAATIYFLIDQARR